MTTNTEEDSSGTSSSHSDSERTWREDSRGLSCYDSMPALVSTDASSDGTSMQTDVSYGSGADGSEGNSSGYDSDVEGSVSVK